MRPRERGCPEEEEKGRGIFAHQGQSGARVEGPTSRESGRAVYTSRAETEKEEETEKGARFGFIRVVLKASSFNLILHESAILLLQSSIPPPIISHCAAPPLNLSVMWSNPNILGGKHKFVAKNVITTIKQLTFTGGEPRKRGVHPFFCDLSGQNVFFGGETP